MPFFFAALIIGLILSIFLVPKPKIENAKAALLSDFQFPRADEGAPVPRIYGTVKTKGVNTIGQCNFNPVPIRKKVSTGLFSHKHITTGYKYHCGLNLAVCLGPGVVYRRLWYGNHLIWAGCLYDGGCVTREYIDLPELLGGDAEDGTGNGGIQGWIDFYCGAFDQPADPYLAANLTKPNPDDQMPAYPGISHMVFEDFWWGNSPNILTVAVEVSVFTNSLGLSLGRHVMPNGLDANPVEVLYDLYVNDWGNLGIKGGVLDVASWRAAAYQVYTEGNGASVEIANPNTGADVSKNILAQIDGMLYQNPTSGMVELLLMRRDYVIADLPVLGPDQISALTNFTKKLWADTINRVRIQYKNRDNDYQDAVATADDFGNIRFQGHVRATDVGMPMCYVSSLASQLAARQLSNLNIPLYQCDLEMNRVNIDLAPGKPFVLNWPEYGITQMVMRIRKMGLGSRKTGKVTMTVIQDQYASDAVVVSTPVPPTTDSANYSPTDITAPAPLFFELPYWMSNEAGHAAAAGRTFYGTFAKKPGSASLNYNVYLDDNATVDGVVTDTEVLDSAPYTATATLVAAVDKYDGFDNGLLPTLNIANLDQSTALAAGSLAALQSDGQGLFYLNGEILGYETFTDNGDGTFTLNNAHRALLDTGLVSSAIGDRLYFFNGQEAFWDVDVAVAAVTAYALDHAYTGHSTEAAATKTVLAPVGRQALPLPPDYITIDGVREYTPFVGPGETLNLVWHERNRTAASISIEPDATVAPEAATTYDVTVVKHTDGTLLQTEAGVTTPYALTLDPAIQGEAVRFEVAAKKGGLASFSKAISWPITVVSPTSLEVDGDYVTVDFQTVEF